MKHLLSVLSVLALLCCIPARGQLVNCDCPNGSRDSTINVNVCWLGNTYVVPVTFCWVKYVPPAVIAECNLENLAQDYVIRIKKICPPLGGPIPLANLIAAIQGKFDVCCGNFFNFSIPNIDDKACYMFAIPKCWQMVANCWEPCHNSKCCVIRVDWTNRGPGDPCQRVVKQICLAPDECPTGCTLWECSYITACPCP